MAEFRGWLLDLYENEEDGLVLWFAGESGARHRLWQPFPVTFYAAGQAYRLRELWRYLRNSRTDVVLGRTQRQDLFSGQLDVMSIRVSNPAAQNRLFYDTQPSLP